MTRFLYLHGFASSPQSRKAVVFAAHLKKRGEDLLAVDLRVPTLETLLVSAMIATSKAAIDDDKTILVGSSLGALTAAHVAAIDARVAAVVLLAPAFGMVPRWRQRLGDDGVARWRNVGWLPLLDPEGPQKLHYEFLVDAERVEAGGAPNVAVPTLVIHGQRDDVVPIESSRRWAHGRKNVRVVEVDDDHALYGSMDLICAELDAFRVL